MVGHAGDRCSFAIGGIHALPPRNMGRMYLSEVRMRSREGFLWCSKVLRGGPGGIREGKAVKKS